MIAIVGGIVGILGAVALLAFIYYRPPDALYRVSVRMHALAAFLEPLGLWPYCRMSLKSWSLANASLRDWRSLPSRGRKFKQLITFFQVLLSLGVVYRVDLPQQFYEAFDWLQWITFVRVTHVSAFTVPVVLTSRGCTTLISHRTSSTFTRQRALAVSAHVSLSPR